MILFWQLIGIGIYREKLIILGNNTLQFNQYEILH